MLHLNYNYVLRVDCKLVVCLLYSIALRSLLLSPLIVYNPPEFDGCGWMLVKEHLLMITVARWETLRYNWDNRSLWKFTVYHDRSSNLWICFFSLSSNWRIHYCKSRNVSVRDWVSIVEDNNIIMHFYPINNTKNVDL